MSTPKTHPSFGMLSFCRSQGGLKKLFGSSIEHRNTITMYLREGSVERDLNHDFYMGNNLIAEVEMSLSQFSEAITSMNMGSGVPVTIKWLQNKGKIEDCPFENKCDQFKEEFRNTCEETNAAAIELLKEAEELLQKKTALTKADKARTLDLLTKLHQNLESTQPYINSQFIEQMDKTVLEAKGEIEGFMQNKMFSIANQALVENKDALLSSIDESLPPIEIDAKSDDKG